MPSQSGVSICPTPPVGDDPLLNRPHHAHVRVEGGRGFQWFHHAMRRRHSLQDLNVSGGSAPLKRDSLCTLQVAETGKSQSDQIMQRSKEILPNSGGREFQGLKARERSYSLLMDEKQPELAGPGIGDYREVEKELPTGYVPLLNPKETQRALFMAKDYIEEGLCRRLNLMPVTVPLIVDSGSGINDYLDRDGSRSPIRFHISNDREQHPVDAEVVQAATKWKRMALRQFELGAGEGLLTDMRAIRKDYFLDHDHSAYVDQWDWELHITQSQRNLKFLTEIVDKIWAVLKGAERLLQEKFSQLHRGSIRTCPNS